MNLDHEKPPRLPPISAAKDLSDGIFGIAASFAAIIVGIIVWGLLFDSTGGEPFSSTVFGALLMSPILLILIIGGWIAWLHHRTIKKRWIIFGIQVLGTHVAIGLSWLIG